MTGAISRLPAALQQLEAPPVFVVGAHRSGTTWVYEMLSAYPCVAGVFESGLFAADIGLAQIFGPKHWYDATAMDEDKEFFGRPFRLPQLLTRGQLTEDVRELTGAWLAKALGPEDRFLVEKTPQHARVIPLLTELFPGSAILHVVRDGRDVAVSALEAARSWPRGRIRRLGVGDLAHAWADTVLMARRLGAAEGNRYRELRYEELHADPTAIHAVLRWAGIPASTEAVAGIVESTSFTAQPATGRDGFRRAGRVGDWRISLGLTDRLRFERAAGDALREMGYDAGPRWWLRRGVS